MDATNYADLVNRHVIRTGHLRKEDYREQVHMPDGIFSKMKLSVGDMYVDVVEHEGISKKELLRIALKAFVEKYGVPDRKNGATTHCEANYADLVNRHVMRTGCMREEEYSQNESSSTIKIQVSDMSVTASAPLGIAKKDLRNMALKAFVERYGLPAPKATASAKDYINESRNTVIAGANIHINDTKIFEKKLDIVAFDTEGQYPPTTAQLCSDPKHVYIFDLSKHMDQVKGVLADRSVKKIVCDINAEQAQVGPICNYYDIQEGQKKSLVKIIEDTFGLCMYKNKRIHFDGWRFPLSDDQIDYAAADALWTYLCYKKMHSG